MAVSDERPLEASHSGIGRSTLESPDGPADDELDDPGDPVAVARTICLRQLAVRPRSRAELVDVLRRRGVPDWAAIEVLDRYSEVGLVDDAEYAAMVVRAQHNGRGLSRRAVHSKLREKGIADDDAAAALAQIDSSSEYAAALRVAERKLRSLGPLDAQVRARRVYGLLARRGYSATTARRVIDQLVHGVNVDNYEAST